MAGIGKTKASLRVIGDDLIPDDITNELGGFPSFSHAKGEVIVGQSGAERVTKFGMWRLEADVEIPGDLDRQIEAIFGELTENLDSWAYISDSYRVELFCGLFLSGGNEGIEISSENLRMLGERNIEIQFDIYAPDSYS